MKISDLSPEDIEDLGAQGEAAALQRAVEIVDLRDDAKVSRLVNGWNKAATKVEPLTRADVFSAVAMLIAHVLMDIECPGCRRSESAQLMALANSLADAGVAKGEGSVH